MLSLELQPIYAFYIYFYMDKDIRKKIKVRKEALVFCNIYL